MATAPGIDRSNACNAESHRGSESARAHADDRRHGRGMPLRHRAPRGRRLGGERRIGGGGHAQEFAKRKLLVLRRAGELARATASASTWSRSEAGIVSAATSASSRSAFRKIVRSACEKYASCRLAGRGDHRARRIDGRGGPGGIQPGCERLRRQILLDGRGDRGGRSSRRSRASSSADARSPSPPAFRGRPESAVGAGTGAAFEVAAAGGAVGVASSASRGLTVASARIGTST
jgi:hypothetical protein